MSICLEITVLKMATVRWWPSQSEILDTMEFYLISIINIINCLRCMWRSRHHAMVTVFYSSTGIVSKNIKWDIRMLVQFEGWIIIIFIIKRPFHLSANEKEVFFVSYCRISDSARSFVRDTFPIMKNWGNRSILHMYLST